MSTIGKVIDRIYRTYLRPPDMQEAVAFLESALDTTQTTFTISTFAIPEDVEHMAVGVLLEIGQELVRVRDYDQNTRLVTVLRADEGTNAATHSAGDKIILAPSYSRLSTFEAVGDNIISLYPRLFTVKVQNVATVVDGIAPLPDDLAVDVISVWDDTRSNDNDYGGSIVEYHPAAGGRALITSLPLGSGWLRYRRRMTTPTGETDDLDDLGVDERWAGIIMAGAAADLLAGSDISAVHTDWISQSFESEMVRPGTRTTIATRLAGYRDLLLDRFEAEMKSEYKPSMGFNDWTAQG